MKDKLPEALAQALSLRPVPATLTWIPWAVEVRWTQLILNLASKATPKTNR